MYVFNLIFKFELLSTCNRVMWVKNKLDMRLCQKNVQSKDCL